LGLGLEFCDVSALQAQNKIAGQSRQILFEGLPPQTQDLHGFFLQESQLHSMQAKVELQVIHPLGGCVPALPTAKVVRDFERAYTIFFPQSYVDFIRTHGPGELNGWVRIHAPRVSKKSMLTLEELLAGTNDMSHVSSDRFVPFATTGGGDTFYWRFRGPASSRNEHTIYYRERTAIDRTLFSKTFAAFIKSICAGRRLGIKPANVYQPFGKPLSQSQLNKLILERRREALALLPESEKAKIAQNKAVNRSRR
jgi:hypothetical protein